MSWARAHDFDTAIAAASVATAIPSWVIKATIAKESSFNPKEKRDDPGGKTSRGLMQLLPGTASDMGYLGPVGDDLSRSGGLYDPVVSITYGARYLRFQRRRYPNAPWDHIYAAYNAGSLRFEDTDDGRQLVNESHIVGWRRAADEFMPGWRSTAPPPFDTLPPGRAG